MFDFKSHKQLWFIFGGLVILVVLIGGYLSFLQIQGVPETQSGTSQTESGAVVLEGTYVCLQPEGAPKPKDCTPGITVEGGEQYALDLGPVIDMGGNPQLVNGAKISVAGIVVSAEEVSTDQWKKFSIKGIMRVEELAKQ